MERVISDFLRGDMDIITMLLLFIVGVLTKRFVPWWVHEEVLDKLKEYEKTAPSLISEVHRLIGMLEEAKIEPPEKGGTRMKNKIAARRERATAAKQSPTKKVTWVQNA